MRAWLARMLRRLADRLDPLPPADLPAPPADRGVVLVRFFHAHGHMETKRLPSAEVIGRRTVKWKGKKFRPDGREGDMVLCSELMTE